MKDIHLRDFIVESEENKEHIPCKGKKTMANSWWIPMTFPLNGVPKVMGDPCEHMVAGVKEHTFAGTESRRPRGLG
jgi:hypothetical protein